MTLQQEGEVSPYARNTVTGYPLCGAPLHREMIYAAVKNFCTYPATPRFSAIPLRAARVSFQRLKKRA